MSKTVKKKASPVKKAKAKSGAKKAAPKKAKSKKAAAKKVAPKKAAPKKAAPKKAAPKKAKSKKVAVKKVAPKKAKPKKVAPKKAAPKKAAPKKAAPKKAAPKKAAPKKATPKKKAPSRKSASFKKVISRQLLDLRKQILNEVADKVKNESDTHKLEIGDIYDIASSERERELTFILGDRDRAKLSEIDDALERIGDGVYGECEECGEGIAEQRLKALPFTRVCIECKSRYERHQGFISRFEEDGGTGILERSGADEDEL
jgi:RNA polymerase-binding protein DksA